MKVKSNFMGNDTKIKANTIAMIDNNKGIPLDEYLGNLSDLNTIDKSSVVNSINEINNKSAITLQLTSNQTIGIGYSVIQFNNTDTQIGNGLTVSSTGVVKIGSGISAIKVSFYLNLSNSANPQVPIVHILKNGSNLQQSGASIVGTTNSNFPLTIANYIVEVAENDLISIEIAGNSANVTIRNGSIMTVESI